MLVEYLLPPGLRGIVVAGLLSALMGWPACSTPAPHFSPLICTRSGGPAPRSTRSSAPGAWLSFVMVLITLAWIPVIKNASGLYVYLQAVQGYLAP